MLSVGKEKRPAVAVLKSSGIELRCRFWCASRVRHSKDGGRNRRREQDYAVAVPGSAAGICGVADDLRRSAIRVNLLQLANCKETDLPAVRGPERIGRFVRAWQHLRRHRIQRTDIELDASFTIAAGERQ